MAEDRPGGRAPVMTRLPRTLAALLLLVVLVALSAWPGPVSATTPDVDPVVDPGDIDVDVSVDAVAANDGFTLTQLAQQPHSDGKGQGSAVAIANGIAVVSNGGASPGGLQDDDAKVYVYAEDSPNPGAWGLVATLDRNSADGNGSHRWGQALDFDGTTLVIGDPTYDCSDITGDVLDNCSGQVVIFQVDPSDPSSWTYKGSAVPLQANEKNNLGSAVAVSGNWMVAGAPGTHFGDIDDPSDWGSAEYVEIWDISSGSPVRVFKKRWWDFGYVPIDGQVVELGASVAIDGDWAFFGAPTNDVPGDGVVCMANYYSKGTDSAGNPNPAAWHTVTPCLSGEGQGGFGQAIAYSDQTDTLAIGAPTAGDQPGDPPGSVFLYETSTGSVPSCLFVTAQVCDTLPTAGFADGDDLGSSLAFSPAGDVLLAGAPGPSGDSGLVAVYEEALPDPDLGGSWGLGGTFDAGTYQQPGAQFGAAVGIGPGANPGEVLAIVGAPNQSNPDPPGSTGFAYVFTGAGNAAMGLSAPSTGGDPLVVSPGDTVTVTTTLTNASNNEALELAIAPDVEGPTRATGAPVLPVSSQKAVVGGYDPPGFWSCDDSLSCAASGPFPPGASTTFSFTLQVPDEQDALGRWDVDFWAWWDNPSVGGSVTAGTFFFVGPPSQPDRVDLTSAQAPTGIAYPGQQATFDATLVNASASPLDNPVVTALGTVEDGPGVSSTVTTADAGWSCTGATCSHAGGLPPGASVRFTVAAQLPDFGSDAAFSPLGTLDLDVSATWQNGPDGPATQTASATAPVGSPIVLSTTGPTTAVPAGSTQTYTWTITNGGIAELGQFRTQLVYAMSEIDVSDVSASGGGTWRCGTDQVSGAAGISLTACEPDGGTFPVGSTATVTLTGVVHRESTISFEARWRDPVDYVDGPTYIRTPVTRDTDLGVTGSPVPPAPPGGSSTVGVTGTNRGPAEATGATYRITTSPDLAVEAVLLPDGTTVAVAQLEGEPPSAHAGWRCWHDGDVACATTEPLAVAATHDLRIQAGIAPDASPGSEAWVDISVASDAPELSAADNEVRVAVPIATPGIRTADATSRPTSRALPVTGAETIVLLLAAVGLMAVGRVLLCAARRREALTT